MKKSLSDHNHFLHIIYIVLMQIGLHSAIEHLSSHVCGQLGGFAVVLKKAIIKLLFWCGEAWQCPLKCETILSDKWAEHPTSGNRAFSRLFKLF